jgi:hypothetical protein
MLEFREEDELEKWDFLEEMAAEVSSTCLNKEAEIFTHILRELNGRD